MNQIILIGTVYELPKQSESNNRNATFKMKVEKPFRNEEGVITSDIFTVQLWRGIAETAISHYREGTVVAIKGRLEASENETNKIIAERISFIASTGEAS